MYLPLSPENIPLRLAFLRVSLPDRPFYIIATILKSKSSATSCPSKSGQLRTTTSLVPQDAFRKHSLTIPTTIGSSTSPRYAYIQTMSSLRLRWACVHNVLPSSSILTVILVRSPSVANGGFEMRSSMSPKTRLPRLRRPSLALLCGRRQLPLLGHQLGPQRSTPGPSGFARACSMFAF
jgi:hypothetical protein